MDDNLFDSSNVFYWNKVAIAVVQHLKRLTKCADALDEEQDEIKKELHALETDKVDPLKTKVGVLEERVSNLKAGIYGTGGGAVGAGGFEFVKWLIQIMQNSGNG